MVTGPSTPLRASASTSLRAGPTISGVPIKEIVSLGPAPESPYSTAVKADGLIYLSGTLAGDAAAGRPGAQHRAGPERGGEVGAAAAVGHHRDGRPLLAGGVVRVDLEAGVGHGAPADDVGSGPWRSETRLGRIEQGDRRDVERPVEPLTPIC